MWPISDAMAAALVRSHQSAVRVQILADGQPVRTLEVMDGRVTVDGSANFRRRVTLTLAPSEQPATIRGALAEIAPTGAEVAVARGVRLAGGQVEWVPLVVAGIARVGTDHAGQVTIDGWDRSRRIARARMPRDGAITSGQQGADVVRTLITDGLAGLPVALNLDDPGYQVGSVAYERGDDRWELAQTVARSMGRQLLIDAAGVPTLRATSDPMTAPIVAEVTTTTTLLSSARDVDDEQTYNRAIVIGEHPDLATPIRAEAVDDDPTSPTRVGGPYGDVPTYLVSQLIYTQAQADAAAAALVVEKRGLLEEVSAEAVPHPALDADDVVRVRDDDAGVDDLYAVGVVDIPIRHGTMRLTARRRRMIG